MSISTASHDARRLLRRRRPNGVMPRSPGGRMKQSPMMGLVIALLAASLCAAQSPPAAAPAAKPKDKDVPAKVDPASMNVKADTDSFVLPIPSEVLGRLRNSSYGAQLMGSIKIRAHDYQSLPPWKTALTVGTTLSNVLLGLDSLSKENLLIGLDDLLAGLRRLKVSDLRLAILAKLRADVAAGTLSKAAIVTAFDLMRVDLLNNGKKEFGAQNFGLLVVGGWAQSANLTLRVAQANPAVLADLEVLKVRGVIETYIRLLGDGPEVQPVKSELNKVLAITTTGRVKPPTEAEADLLRKATNGILSQAQP
jgi:hypothetical protein